MLGVALTFPFWGANEKTLVEAVLFPLLHYVGLTDLGLKISWSCLRRALQ